MRPSVQAKALAEIALRHSAMQLNSSGRCVVPLQGHVHTQTAAPGFDDQNTDIHQPRLRTSVTYRRLPMQRGLTSPDRHDPQALPGKNATFRFRNRNTKAPQQRQPHHFLRGELCQHSQVTRLSSPNNSWIQSGRIHSAVCQGDGQQVQQNTDRFLQSSVQSCFAHPVG